MFYTKDHKTGYIFDPWRHLGPKRRRLLEESWGWIFRKEILDELPVNQIASFFSKDEGCPTKELYTALGSLPPSTDARCDRCRRRLINWPLMSNGIMP